MNILYVDPVAEHRLRVAEAFNAAGLSLRYVTDVAQTPRALRTLKPHLLLVAAEVRSPLTGQILDLLASDTAFAHVPVALVCQDTTDARFLRQLRTGIVALFPRALDLPSLIERVRVLVPELLERTGTAAGQGDSRELTALVEHLRRTQRSGALTVNPRTPEVGNALFVRGVLKSAEHLGAQGVEALLAMVGSPRASWSFSEVGHTEGGVLLDLAAATGEHPLLPPPDEALITGEPLEEELLLDVEVGAPQAGEQEVLIATAAPSRRTDPNRTVLPILLVDDDESLCRMFTLLFRKHGFDVQTAGDGFAGYEAALDRRFDIIVADLNMPRMDGWGMLRLLRDDFRTREVPVVFLSCHDDYRDTLRALDSGAQGYFSKSTRLDALATQVRSVLEPRLTVRKELVSHHTVQLAVGKLGPQWLIREIGRAQVSGALEAKDSWAKYRIVFWDGRPVHASAQAGRHAAEGERAFNAFIASRGAEGTFERGEFPANANLTLSGDELCARGCALLNDNEARIRDSLLVQASEIRIDRELYGLYAEVGPRQWLETARLICEERLPPREVIARVDASPLEVEETMRDLIRRGVLRLSA